MNQKLLIVLFSMLLVLSDPSHATLLSPAGVSATGSYNHSSGLIIDGVIPTEGSSWTGATNVYWNGTASVFSVDLGKLYKVDDVRVSVDNNDAYTIEWSKDAIIWNNLFTISIGYGEIGWGMDTMSTDNTDGEYIAALDFSSVQARYLRIFATAGDNMYSVGELQAFGSVSTVPVPAAAWLFCSALFGLLRFRKKQE